MVAPCKAASRSAGAQYTRLRSPSAPAAVVAHGDLNTAARPRCAEQHASAGRLPDAVGHKIALDFPEHPRIRAHRQMRLDRNLQRDEILAPPDLRSCRRTAPISAATSIRPEANGVSPSS